MNRRNNLVLLLISLFIINFLISYNFNDDKAVFAQETTAGQFSTYTNERYGITMQYPSDWTKNEDIKSEEDYFDEGFNDEYVEEGYIEERIVQFSKDINYFEGDVSLYIDSDILESLDEYLSSTIETYEEYKKGFEIISSSAANTGQTLSGNPAYVLEYTTRGTEDDTLDTRFLEIGTKIGNDYYFVEYFADQDDSYFNSLPIAQKMIDSIKIGKDAATSTLSQPPQQQLQPTQQQPTQQPQIIIPKSNTPPTAMNSSVITIQNQSINISLEIYDKEGDMVDISVVEAPQFGELTIKDINTKTLTYTPNPDYVGYDSFIFQGKDRNNASSNKATVSITIASLPPSSQPTISANTDANDGDKLTSSTTKGGSQGSSAGSNLLPPTNTTTTTTIPPPPPTPHAVSPNTNQNLNNLNQQQLIDLIATTISNANNIDKNKVTQAINDMIEPIKAKGGNVIESLQRIAGVISKDPTGFAAKNIMNIVKTK